MKPVSEDTPVRFSAEPAPTAGKPGAGEVADMIRILKALVTDFDGSQMSNDESPRDMHCNVLREAAALIASQASELTEPHAEWADDLKAAGQLGVELNEARAEPTALRERLAAAEKAWSKNVS